MPKKNLIKTEVKALSSTKTVTGLTAMLLVASGAIAALLTWALFS